MPWRPGSDLPLRITSTASLVTVPEWLNLSVDDRLTTMQYDASRKVSSHLLRSAIERGQMSMGREEVDACR